MLNGFSSFRFARLSYLAFKITAPHASPGLAFLGLGVRRENGALTGFSSRKAGIPYNLCINGFPFFPAHPIGCFGDQRKAAIKTVKGFGVKDWRLLYSMNLRNRCGCYTFTNIDACKHRHTNSEFEISSYYVVPILAPGELGYIHAGGLFRVAYGGRERG